jgi:hypothetical protein
MKLPSSFPVRRTMQVVPAQRGNTLFVALILLLLASVITLLTLRVGVFEQRTSGNDVRAKLIAQVAEAGIAQGAEYLRLNPDALTNAGNWQVCDANSDEFPCGSIPDMDVDDGAGGLTKRRGTMYYWFNAGAGDNNNDGTSGDVFDRRMLPIHSVIPAAGRVTSVGNFDQVSYGVGVVLCRVATPNSPADPTRCTTNASEASNTYVYNFVSVASLPGEGTRTTVSQMLGQYLIFNPEMNKPPIVASGSVDITGTLQIVTNPNAAGPGVPVSVWTRKDISKTGTPNTCYYDEFIRYGAKNNAPATWEEGIIVCDTCNCEGDKSLSYDKAGNFQAEGIDILDIDGNQGVNYDVRPEEFPCDLFQFVFGVETRTDEDGDHFCETKKPQVAYTNPNTGVVAMLDVDEAYLYSNATYIMPRDAAATALMSPSQALPGAYPSSALSGIIWCQTGCNIGSNQQLGTPSKPVLLVIDGSARIQGRVFGLVFMRSLDDELDPVTGGSATLDMNAGAAVYGSVVVQGEISKANGTAAVIYNEDVFRNLSNSIPPRNSNLPGAWTDRLSY